MVRTKKGGEDEEVKRLEVPYFKGEDPYIGSIGLKSILKLIKCSREGSGCANLLRA